MTEPNARKQLIAFAVAFFCFVVAIVLRLVWAGEWLDGGWILSFPGCRGVRGRSHPVQTTTRMTIFGSKVDFFLTRRAKGVTIRPPTVFIFPKRCRRRSRFWG
jgi:hypothetical protein